MADKIPKQFGRSKRLPVGRMLLVTICVLLSISLAAEKKESKESKEPRDETARSSNVAVNEGWQEAAAGYPYSFPRDHASHPSYKIEWWYYTGNLESKSGRRFGYQLTFFRVGVLLKPLVESRWAVRDLFMAHFAISDIERKRFYPFERINRAGVGWAGADTDNYRVWNEDWEVRLEGNDHLLRAGEDGFSIYLKLVPEKREVIHGRDGISQRGPSVSNASHYSSITRLSTTGKITVEGEEFEVKGTGWMDHEFGTSFLESKQKGWDWFSIQLQDGRELMLFQIRRADGSVDPRSSGTLIEKDGSATHIEFDDFTLAPVRSWTSEKSGGVYPVEWRIELPRYGLQLDARAAFTAQELRATESTGVTYWEGSIEIEGAKGERGRGYLEMTGYSGQNMGEIVR